MATKSSAAQQKYDAANTTRIYIKLNNRTDLDIIERLEEAVNKQGYIKSLIRKDIEQDREL